MKQNYEIFGDFTKKPKLFEIELHSILILFFLISSIEFWPNENELSQKIGESVIAKLLNVMKIFVTNVKKND